jgi:hypothetical protein
MANAMPSLKREREPDRLAVLAPYSFPKRRKLDVADVPAMVRAVDPATVIKLLESRKELDPTSRLQMALTAGLLMPRVRPLTCLLYHALIVPVVRS